MRVARSLVSCSNPSASFGQSYDGRQKTRVRETFALNSRLDSRRDRRRRLADSGSTADEISSHTRLPAAARTRARRRSRELRRFLNVDHQGWTLIKALLVAALRPSVPCPILVAKGEQGAGKTTACRIISTLIDPRTGALRGAPRELRHPTAAARNSWIVCFDNLSHLPDELADAACRLATGGGFGGRELYSDHDEAIFDATRPMVFNAIPDLGAARPDFLDRAVIVELLDLKPEMRRDEAQFWREFDQARPRIWARCSMPPRGTWEPAQRQARSVPRMADFAIWISACEESLGMKPGEALTTYQSNRTEAHNLALESSPLYEPVAKLARRALAGRSQNCLRGSTAW